MKHILKIYDFIHSWIYYPKMKKYLNGIGVEYRMSRLQYSLWHCKTGNLSDIGYKNMQPTAKDVSDSWKFTYRNEPIEKH